MVGAANFSHPQSFQASRERRLRDGVPGGVQAFAQRGLVADAVFADELQDGVVQGHEGGAVEYAYIMH